MKAIKFAKVLKLYPEPDPISHFDFTSLLELYEKREGEDMCDYIPDLVDTQAKTVKELIDAGKVKDVRTEIDRLSELELWRRWCFE